MIQIPRIFHSIWVGSKPFPEEFKKYQATWVELNPGWELMFWTEENLPADLIRKEIFETLRVPAERADMLRLEVLFRHGGIYVDADMECLKPLEPIIGDLDFFTADLKPGRINNAFIGSTPGHKILEQAIRELTPVKFYGYDKAAAGPSFLDKIVKQHPGTKIFEPWVVYPSSPLEREKAFADHHHERSWKDAEGFKKSAETAEKRLNLAQAQLMNVYNGLKALETDPRAEAAKAEIERLVSKISYHGENPTLAEKTKNKNGGKKAVTKKAVPTLLSSLMDPKALILDPKARAQTKKLFEKRVLRRVLRAYNKSYRYTYANRLDTVRDRDEIPALLNARGLTGIGLEIGVKKGGYSEYLLTHWKGSKLISVDPWLEDKPENYIDHANVEQNTHNVFYEMTKKRLAKFGKRSDIWRMKSDEAAEKVEDGYLDFVYIDARHDYASVKEDLHLWYPKMKPGGLICGHDYADGHFDQGDFGVKSAVDEFFAEKGLEVAVTQGQWPVEMFASWIVLVPPRAGKAKARKTKSKSAQPELHV